MNEPDTWTWPDAYEKGGTMNDLFTEPKRQNTLSESERNELVLSCLPWCRRLANKAAAACDAEVEDLEAEARLALVLAAREFDPTRGVRFITFATPWVDMSFRSMLGKRGKVAADGMSQPELVAQDDERSESEVEPYEPNEAEALMLRALPEPDREIVRLVVFEGARPDQVAERFGMAVKDVKLRIRNAAAKLGRWIESESEPNLFDEYEKENKPQRETVAV